MMAYGKEEEADVLIEQLTIDRDPCIRYGGCFTIATAYCGTADNKAVKKLLHIAVSDVNDDVRRAAVISLGFLNFRNPETVPKLVALLAESFNFHVRYAACIAVGIACAGTGLKDAIDMLNPMLDDASDIVRQGAFIAMAMVMQQVAEVRSPTVKKFYDLIQTVIADKHQSVMTKMGAILAAGIIDAGGRNCAISMLSRAGFIKMGSVLGMLMFCQYWYWYPLNLFLSLTFKPTVLIGLNKNFDIPNQFDVLCNAPESLFAYPKVEEKKDEEKKTAVTAVLSTTLKNMSRERRKEAKKARDPSSPSSKLASSASSSNLMDTSTASAGVPLQSTPSNIPSRPEGAERVNSLLLSKSLSYLSFDEAAVKEEQSKTKVKEAPVHTISNPSRLVPVAQKFLTLIPGQRYLPVVCSLASYASKMSYSKVPAGIVMLTDTQPGSEEDVIKVELVALETDEAAPPANFTWRLDDPFE
jgi:26S proteasome regulatory subunit N2